MQCRVLQSGRTSFALSCATGFALAASLGGCNGGPSSGVDASTDASYTRAFDTHPVDVSSERRFEDAAPDTHREADDASAPLDGQFASNDVAPSGAAQVGLDAPQDRFMVAPIDASGPPLDFYGSIRSIEWHYMECPDGSDFGCKHGDLDPSTEATERARFERDLPVIQAHGFNAVYFQNWWITFQPRVYEPLSSAAVAELRAKLTLLRERGMRAILPLNFLLPGLCPEGVEAGRQVARDSSGSLMFVADEPCASFLTREANVRAFDAYVERYLTAIEDFADMVVVMVFPENMEAYETGPRGTPIFDQDAFPLLLRRTLGTMPNRLAPALRARFRFGFHDNWVAVLSDQRASPIDASAFDFYSIAIYPFYTWPDYATAKSAVGNPNGRITVPGTFFSNGAASARSLHFHLSKAMANVRNVVMRERVLPIIFGESGDAYCHDWDADGWHAWINTALAEFFYARRIGSSFWTWGSTTNNDAAGRPWHCRVETATEHSFVRPDGTPRPTATRVQSVFARQAPPVPTFTITGGNAPANAPAGEAFRVTCAMSETTACAVASLSTGEECTRDARDPNSFDCRANATGSAQVLCGTRSALDPFCPNSTRPLGSISLTSDAYTIVSAAAPAAAPFQTAVRVACTYASRDVPCAYAKLGAADCVYVSASGETVTFDCPAAARGEQPLTCGTSRAIRAACPDRAQMLRSVQID